MPKKEEKSFLPKSVDWGRTKVDSGFNLFGKDKKVKPGVKIVGYVTKNHSSTICNDSTSKKTNKHYTNYVGSTHQLPEKTQGYLAKLLDSQKGDFRAFIYETGDKYDKK